MRAALFVCLCIPTAAFAQQQAGATAEPIPASLVAGQQPVPPTSSYHRVLAIVPLTGSGTYDDPTRPMFVPVPTTALATRSGIIAWQHQVSDDGTLAIVELVAATRAAFAEIFASNDPRVKVFEVGLHSQAEMLAAFQQVKASFTFDNFRPLPVR